MKKFFKGFIAILLVMTFLPVSHVNAEDENAVLTIHFHKDDGDYTDYNLWTWDTGTVSDMVLPNFQDDFGIIWEYEVVKGSNVGFIVRGSDGWDKKNCGEDSFVQVDEDTEIWILENDCTIYTENPTDLAGERTELGKIETEEEVMVSDEEASAQLFIHYYRYEADYPYWNVWSWAIGKEGAAFNFEDDDYGMVSKINYLDVSEGDEVGFIIRKGNWQSKDINEDRTYTFSADDFDGSKYVKHIYLLQGDPKVYFDANVDKSPRVKLVQFTGRKTIQVVGVSVNDLNDVTVLDSNGETVLAKHLVREGSNITLLFEDDLDLLEAYKVSVNGYQGEYPVLFDGIYDSKLFTDNFTYEGDDLGVTIENGTKFRLWAPVSSQVKLNLYTSGDYRESDLIESFEMTRSEQGTWTYSTTEDLSYQYYTYSVDNGNGFVEVADPYAFASGVNGHRSMILDIASINPNDFNTHDKPEGLNFVESIIYELHVRDISMDDESGISAKGKFLGLTETGTTNASGLSTGLDHLIDLGITHLHLLPSFDHRSIDETNLDTAQFNWGYDPYNYSVVEGSYSSNPFLGEVRVDEFKTMVQTLHSNDIRVVMDVVYNHTGASQDSHLNRIVPNYYYRTINGNFSNGSGCGNETASERPMVRKLIVDSVAFWAREYKIDGFRFDLMALHDVETMNQVRAALNEIDDNIIIYGEGWTGGGTPLPQRDQALKINVNKLNNIAVFSDDIRDGIKGSVFNATEKGFVSGDFTKHMGVKFGIVGGVKHDQVMWSYNTNHPSQIINYVSAHDNLSLWDKLVASNGEENSIEELKKMHNMANAIVLTSQGVPFLHAGVELNRSKDGDHNSYQSSDEVNAIEWQLKTENESTYEYYKGLIALRKARPEFTLNDALAIQDKIEFYETAEGVIAYSIEAEYADTQLVFNATNEEQIIETEFGLYKIVVNGDKAGTKMLGISFGTITAAPYTSVVLVGLNPYLALGLTALVIALIAVVAFMTIKKKK